MNRILFDIFGLRPIGLLSETAVLEAVAEVQKGSEPACSELLLFLVQHAVSGAPWRLREARESC